MEGQVSQKLVPQTHVGGKQLVDPPVSYWDVSLKSEGFATDAGGRCWRCGVSSARSA